MDLLKQKIYRSKRRTIGLEITSQAELLVRAPFVASDQNIIEFLKSKKDWISRKQKIVNNRIKKYRKPIFIDGREVLYLGKSYRMKIVNEERIKLSNFFEFPAIFLHDNPQTHLEDWYKTEATKTIKERCVVYAQKMGLKYQQIKINNARKRLGSCSPKNILNFSWRLLLVPVKVVDYVIIHELCHLEIKEHSQRFWNSVKTAYPSYNKNIQWIKDHMYLLN